MVHSKLIMDVAFQSAISPYLQHCLRLRLEPLTVGHWFLLARYCPALVDTELSTLNSQLSLPLAVLICCQPYEKWKGNFPLAHRLFCVLWGFLCRRLDPDVELAKFYEYLRANLKAPAVNVPADAASRETSAPFGFWVLSFLMAEFGLTEREALRTTCLHALCLRAARAEALGQVQLQSARSRRLLEYVRERRNASPQTFN